MTQLEHLTSRKEAALLVLFLGVILLVLLRRLLRAKQTPVVLILGGSGAGKTTLFHQLRDGSSHQGSVPSMVQNSDIIQLSQEDSKKVGLQIIDIPGHPRLRGEAEKYYSKAGKILFLIDAADFMAQKSMIGEHLFEVISNQVVQKRRIPLLLLCNKEDQGAKAHTPEFIRKRMEKELDAVRATRSTLGEGVAQGNDIGISGEIFTFGSLKSPAVTVGSCSALTGDITQVKSFLL